MISTITTVLAEATRARSRVGTDSFDAKMNLGSRLNARCSVVRRKEESATYRKYIIDTLARNLIVETRLARSSYLIIISYHSTSLPLRLSFSKGDEKYIVLLSDLL